MLSWRCLRLSLCLAVMLAMLAVGGFAWVRWGTPPAPFGPFLRRASPFTELRYYFARAELNSEHMDQLLEQEKKERVLNR